MSNLPIYSAMFRSTAAHSSIRIFFSVATAASMIFVVRLLGPEEYGKLSLTLQIAVTAGLILSWGSSSTLGKFLPEIPAVPEQGSLASKMLGWILVSFALFTAAFLGLAAAAPALFPAELRSAKTLVVAFAGLFAVFNWAQGTFRGIGKFVGWSWMEGANDLTARLGALGVIVWISRRYDAVLTPFVLALLFWTALASFRLKPYFRPSGFRMPPNVVRYALLMLAGSVLFMAATTLDAALLRGLLKDTSQVGYYFAGVRIPLILLTLLLSPLSIPFLYYFSHQDTFHTRERVYEMGTKLAGVLCGVISLLFFTLARPLVVLFYSQAYLGSVAVLQIYGFVLFLVSLQIFSGPYFAAINKPHLSVAMMLLTIALLAPLDLWLIPRMEAAGAALANVLMLTAQTLVITYLVLRNRINVLRTVLTLMAGMILSVALELWALPYSSLPAFLCFVLASRLVTRDEFAKIKAVLLHKPEATA
ncbi:MAG: hypothetical protein A2902_00030 [Elusimicrobia bacterium RIFCSPLOWO2_01_FULL_64_13]|nr:MAG: hypothetical protein A2636_00555 [Elusimicrobia bacterium RIFCSPHIGHO2_01_FULL_64_10]OGR97970.1 MAG: hypothetical protein A2902_00030 [Elusimicrobia bacterium RIFCSPLOWO2_01_FULL_64_13]